jgi:hypothetical protein
MKNNMKKISTALLVFAWSIGQAQTNDDRMERDLRVAEDVLSSLIKQQFENTWLPVDVQATYRAGYGVTFSVPNFSGPLYGIVAPRVPRVPNAPRVRVYSGQGEGFTYSIETNEDGDIVEERFEGDEEMEEELQRAEADRHREDAEEARQEAMSHEDAARQQKRINGSLGSLQSLTAPEAATGNAKEFNKKLVEAAKLFLADYSAIISQLKAEERIMITNRNTEGGNRYWRFMGDEQRYFLSVEALAVDVKQYQTSKLTREQFISKIKVVESEVESERSQDLELLTTIFDRLYDADLSRTFFTEGEIYYERLKDYGAIYYMNIFSSNQMNRGSYYMPTQKLHNLSEEERNKKVTELYPTFEKELKENILEYGRTIKSLKPEEVLVFNVKLTKCKGCGIPATLEVSVKASVLTQYLAGTLNSVAAMGKMDVKKGAEQ